MRVGIAGYGLSGRSFHAPLLKGCGFDVATVLTGNSYAHSKLLIL